MAWYLVTLRCSEGHMWTRRTKNPASADPPCPILDCASRQSPRNGTRVTYPTDETPAGPPIGMDLSLNKAPATIGGNIQVKAIDETANIVMQDYGFTDLRSDVRETESAAPKLAPALQAQADNFFGGPKGRNAQAFGGINLGRHARAALAGRLVDPQSTNSSLVAVHRTRARPPVHLVGDDQTARR
jgi:hypothetical protein